MAAGTEITDMEITWGDTVRVKKDSPERFRPGKVASVCGIRVIDSEEIALLVGAPIGETLFNIEYIDGSAIEVPARYLEKLAEEA